MATATVTTPTLACTPATRGFPGLRCPFCGQEDNITLNLADVKTFTCGECDEEFTGDDVLEILERWQKVLAWVDLAPATE